MSKKILKDVDSYYTEKIKKNGPTPQGVDWNSEESQFLRFDVLSTLISDDAKFSVLDYGCGFGSMFDFYKRNFQNFDFFGYDISNEMIENAKRLHADDNNSFWHTDITQISKVDYVIASGIFNVRLENNDEDWLKYILATLHDMDKHSEKGFSFNMLTKYSDKEYMRDYLYYADPLYIFDYCKKNFSKWVALRHDYPLYEFTIIVRK